MSRNVQGIMICIMIVGSLIGCVTAPAPPPLPSPTPSPIPSPTPSPVPSLTPSPIPSATQAPEPLAAIDIYMNRLVNSENFGGAVLVARDGKILFNKAYGMANIEQKIPFSSRTQMYIHGLTESFTATAVLMLQNAGKLNVQDKFCQYFKNCPPAWQEITIHQLLTNTAGFPDYVDADVPQKDTRMTCAQLVEWYAPRPLLSKPGEKFSWTNLGYNLLGCLIENVTGKSYGAFLKETIFDPLQMVDTGYDPDWKTTTIAYQTKGVPNPLTLDMSLFFASFGLHSSLEDLYRWDQALYTEKLLPKKLQEEAFKSYILSTAPTYDTFGYGWYINSIYGHRLIAQGSFEMYKALIWRFPDDHATIILLSNCGWIDPMPAASSVTSEVFR